MSNLELLARLQQRSLEKKSTRQGVSQVSKHRGRGKIRHLPAVDERAGPWDMQLFLPLCIRAKSDGLRWILSALLSVSPLESFL